MANLQAKLVSNQLMRAIMIAERLLTRLDARQIAEIVTGFSRSSPSRHEQRVQIRALHGPDLPDPTKP
jgi:hypothetical protein